MKQIMHRIGLDERGAALIEMALVAPFLAAMVVGIIDLSNAYSVSLQLQQAAQRTVEKAQQTIVTDTMLATLQAEGASAASGIGSTPITASNVTVDFWLECNGTRQSLYDSTCASGQTHARYLKVSITGSYIPVFSTHFAGSNSDGSFTLTGVAGIRTE